MSLTPLATSELPELEAFFTALSLRVSRENLEQFSAPRAPAPGIEAVTLVMREGGRIVGTVGWIDVPCRVNDPLGRPLAGAPDRARWPLNLYLLPERRGRGLGKKLMEATREGAGLRLVIGGNQLSMPVLDRTGWSVIGSLSRVRWIRPCWRPARWPDRFRSATRRVPAPALELRLRRDDVVARRFDHPAGWLPWAAAESAGAPEEAGVPRDARYLEFAFDGALKPYHTLHHVTVNGALSGFFVLAPRAEGRGWLATEIVDLDAIPGRETHVLAAAREAALSCGDVARLRICGDRFVRALSGLTRRAATVQDHPLRISCDERAAPQGPYRARAGCWRLTYGDHDQYRVRSASQVWAHPEEGVGEAAGATR